VVGVVASVVCAVAGVTLAANTAHMATAVTLARRFNIFIMNSLMVVSEGLVPIAYQVQVRGSLSVQVMYHTKKTTPALNKPPICSLIATIRSMLLWFWGWATAGVTVVAANAVHTATAATLVRRFSAFMIGTPYKNLLSNWT